MQAHVVPIDGEEDGEGGHKEPKNHSLGIAEICCMLGSANLKKNHKIAPPYQQSLWNGGTLV